MILQKEGIPDMVISGSALFLMDFRCFMKFEIRGTQPSFEMHPCYEVTIVKRRFQEISVSRQATFVFL